jgi:hypothetical protein
MGISLALPSRDCTAATMGRKPKKDQSTDISVGQHVAFSEAVQLASSELLEDPVSLSEAQRGSGILNVIGNALVRTIPVYFQDPGVPRARPLSARELEGSQVMHRATVLVLKDGRSLSAVWIKRRDLRRGIGVLRNVGIPDLGKEHAREPGIQQAELLAKVAEIERLARPPLLASQMERLNALAISIARSAPQGALADLAMRLLRALHDARAAGEGADHRPIELIVARLREAIRAS